MNAITEYISQNTELLLETLRTLAPIPAPSHREQLRAEFCKSWLENNGAEGVYIDSALNVIFPLNCEGKNSITVIAAHTDTVFPDIEPYPMTEDGERICCPGVGDDTASVAVLMYTAKYLIQKGSKPEKGILFVLNSCEEGLGNLDGTKQLFKDYAGRIERFISLDSHLDSIHSSCVGSHRYEVEIKTVGGHSFAKFGRKNAINELCSVISEIYSIKVPEKPGSVTTYNVGTIEGGTSVNTIAQNARMLCEYRSNNRECLELMRKEFQRIFDSVKHEEVTLSVTKIGDRPCAGDVDREKQDELYGTCKEILEDVLGRKVSTSPASTDCNIPLSLGIPAICFGVFSGEGSHTREEYILKDSLPIGLAAAIRITLALCCSNS